MTAMATTFVDLEALLKSCTDNPLTLAEFYYSCGKDAHARLILRNYVYRLWWKEKKFAEAFLINRHFRHILTQESKMTLIREWCLYEMTIRPIEVLIRARRYKQKDLAMDAAKILFGKEWRSKVPRELWVSIVRNELSYSSDFAFYLAGHLFSEAIQGRKFKDLPFILGEFSAELAEVQKELATILCAPRERMKKRKKQKAA